MIETTIKGTHLLFETNQNVFSPASIDAGTLAMLSKADFSQTDKILDLGCGYGVIGILAAKLIGEDRVILCDASEEAVQLAKENALENGVCSLSIRCSDAYESIPEKEFTQILSNPPYHTDFSVAKKFIETGFHKLVLGGKMIMVTKRLDWYKNKLNSVFGGVKVFEIDGYYVFISEKRQKTVSKKEKKPQKLSKKLQHKYAK